LLKFESNLNADRSPLKRNVGSLLSVDALGMQMTDTLWGPIVIENWKDTPSISGHVAREEDVVAGRAVYFLKDPEMISAHALEVNVPRCAILTDEESGEELPVVIIQVEQAEDRVYVGYRPLDGGNGICTDKEIELLDEPDARFSGI
jgi:hypothetical protein